VIPGWFFIVIVTPIRADPTPHGVGVLPETCPITVVNRPATRAHHVGLIRSLSHTSFTRGVVTHHSSAA
jgi:hypothetical protein